VDPATEPQLIEWRSALVVVRPETLIRWRRAGSGTPAVSCEISVDLASVPGLSLSARA
jgi:hypothetical protein